jgi:DNA end-binding protein Ku
MADADFEKANVKKTKTINLVGFADESEIDTIFFDKPYFLEPDKGAEKPYTLLVEALKKSKKVGIAIFVLHNREHLAIIKPQGSLLILNQLRYHNEIRSSGNLNIPKSVVAKKEVDMALQLIDQLTTEFRPNQYQDSYIEEMKEIIAEKVKGHKPKKGTPEKSAKVTPIGDIMSLLKKSLEENQKPKKRKKSA